MAMRRGLRGRFQNGALGGAPTGDAMFYRAEKRKGGKPIPQLTGDRPPDRPLAQELGEPHEDARTVAQRLKAERAERLAPRRYCGPQE